MHCTASHFIARQQISKRIRTLAPRARAPSFKRNTTMENLVVFLLVAVTTITCAPQYPQIPRGFNQFNGASNFVCPNYPFCTNNAPAARPAQAAAVPAMINSGAISSLTSSAQQLASNPNVSAGVRNQINSILATVRQQNSGSVLPQVQSLLSLAQQQVQSQNLSPQEKSQANSIIANARQLLSSL